VCGGRGIERERVFDVAASVVAAATADLFAMFASGMAGR
jgi:hypothetical protein